MTLSELLVYCKQKIKENPSLEEDITGLYELACNEVEEGGSEIQECESTIISINDLINEF